jgi:hypothetical protein
LALFIAGLYRREEDETPKATQTIDGSRTLIEAARAKMAS